MRFPPDDNVKPRQLPPGHASTKFSMAADGSRKVTRPPGIPDTPSRSASENALTAAADQPRCEALEAKLRTVLLTNLATALTAAASRETAFRDAPNARTHPPYRLGKIPDSAALSAGDPY